MPRAALALLLLLLLRPGGHRGGHDRDRRGCRGSRTWVVDAVDDTSGNRWESVDTGTTVVTIAVGDTVEWQFDRATMGHDLISLAPAQPVRRRTGRRLSEYRDAR